jgi:hypothetical protein
MALAHRAPITPGLKWWQTSSPSTENIKVPIDVQLALLLVSEVKPSRL